MVIIIRVVVVVVVESRRVEVAVVAAAVEVAAPATRVVVLVELYPQPGVRDVTHWGRDKMAAIFQTTFSKGFS